MTTIAAPGTSKDADGFGSAVALEGDVLVIGAPMANDGRGAAYVYRQDESGVWNYATELSPSGEAELRALGHGVDVMHHHVIVGSQSATFVFDMDDDGVFSQAGRLAADGIDERSGFGSSIASGSGMIYVGAPGVDDGNGAVFAYSHNHDTWEWEAEGRLEVQGLDDGARLGSTIYVGDGFVLASAPRQGGRMGSGAVVMFRKNEDSGEWRQTGQLAPIEVAPRVGFGSAIAGTDEEVWIGASGDNGVGAIYAYSLGETGRFNQVKRMTGSDLPTRAGYGGGLAVLGDIAVVGLTGFDFGEGAATILTREDGWWKEQATVIDEGGTYASVTGGEVRCDADAAGAFPCKDVDMLSFLSVQDMGGARGVRANDIWGWEDPETGAEIAIVGRTDGTSFVDVSDANNPRYLGNLQKTEGSRTAIWRDMKVYNDHVFIVADGAGDHGMQVFDLRRLRGVTTPQEFDTDAHYENIHSAHNVVINEETGFAFVVGASSGGETCGGGLHMVNIQNPTNPTFAGCFADPNTGRRGTGYSHDAQCVTYSGPDADYNGREICFGSNETALSISDVTDKASPVALSSASYPNVAYTHQGWLTEDQRYFYMNDEGDEGRGLVEGTRTLIWDVSDLDDPILAGEYIADVSSIDHNLYIKGNLIYESNYSSGLRVLDISDPTNPVEVGYFDTVPYGDDTPGTGGGSWSNYPYFKSGIVIVTSQREGLFVLKKRGIDI